MRHRLLLLLAFLLLHGTFSGTPAAASCNRWCGGTNVPYPFGFSDGCPISLSCDANTSTPILPYRGDNGTSSYHVVSFNSTSSSLVVSLPPSCTRSVSDVRKTLSGRSYDVSLRTILLLRGGCRGSNAAAGAGCGVPASVMSRLLRTVQCGTNDTSADVACVASAAPNATVARAVSLFWEKVEKQKCVDVLTSAVFMNSAEVTVSPVFKTAELGWWVNGTCAGGEAGGQCVPETATCSEQGGCRHGHGVLESGLHVGGKADDFPRQLAMRVHGVGGCCGGGAAAGGRYAALIGEERQQEEDEDGDGIGRTG